MTSKKQPPWYRQRWPWLLMAPPLAAVVGGLVTVALAVRSDDGVVAADYYKRGLAINAELTRSRRAAELGLQGEVRADGDAAGDHVRVRISSPGVLPGEAALRLRLIHPARKDADRIAMLARVAAAADGLSAEYAGHWQDAPALSRAVAFQASLEGREWRLDGTVAAGQVREFRLGGR